VNFRADPFVFTLFAFLSAASFAGVLSSGSEASQSSARPNILLISIDDLNDWTGFLGGHSQAETPNMDRLAAQGTAFANAHCQAPVCNPSRVSMMLSRYPSSTGVYFLNPDLKNLQDLGPSLPERFKAEGYSVMGGGKIFHGRDNARIFQALGEYGGSFGAFGPFPEEKLSVPGGHPYWDWGAFPEEDAVMPDAALADWAAGKLQAAYEKPFFLAVGFYRPHVPLYVPEKWYDRHPRGSTRLPPIPRADLADVPQYARDLTRLEHVAPSHGWMRGSGEWPHAVQAYLASVTFVDHYVGKVLDALESSPYRDNTIVVLFSDHGFHLGQKERWGKRSLWENDTRVPLVIAGPGAPKGQSRDKPVGLIDVYPTLLELCGLAPDPRLEGKSLVPLLKGSEVSWERPAITTLGRGNHAVRSKRWRYIRYNDGSEELYDHHNDPREWQNLASFPEYREIVSQHARWLPQTEAPVLGENSTGHRAYTAAEGNREPYSPQRQ